jgi:hypothetical protein
LCGTNAEYTLSFKYRWINKACCSQAELPGLRHFSASKLLSCHHSQGAFKQEGKNNQQEDKKKKDKFKEPKIKWNKSKARHFLYKDVQQGQEPQDSNDAKGKTMMQLGDIVSLWPKFAEYAYDKFSSCLSCLRKVI